jgi:tRNA(fMet)-specific endonuclease VapC
MVAAQYLLDANICIYLLGGRNDLLKARVEAHRRGEVVTSAIVRAEVMLGAEEHGQVEQAVALFEQIEALPFDARAANVYASFPFHRGDLDRFIGAHAVSLGLTIVTNDRDDFARMPGLKVEYWTV